MNIYSRVLSILVFMQLAMPLAAQNERVLILDKAMAPWPMLTATAEPWMRVGCTVDYRRYHPFLTRADTREYDVVIILGGLTPLVPGAELTREDIDLLKTMWAAGKGIVLGFQQNTNIEGANDRAAMNQFLREIVAQVQIGNVLAIEPGRRYRASQGQFAFVRRKGDWPFSKINRIPFGEFSPLKILRNARVEIFAETWPEAFFLKKNLRFPGPFPVGAIIESSNGGGPVLLLPRSVLGFAGPGIGSNKTPIIDRHLVDSTRTFLADVALRFLKIRAGSKLKLTPAPSNSAIPSTAETRLTSIPALETVYKTPVFNVTTMRFTDKHFPGKKTLQQVRKRIREQARTGPLAAYLKKPLAILNSRLPEYRKDSQVIIPAKTFAQIDDIARFASRAGSTILWGVANPQALSGTQNYTDSERQAVRRLWQETLSTLEGKNLTWFPGVDYRDQRLPAGQAVGLNGAVQNTWSPLDRTFWVDGYFSPLRAAQKVFDEQNASLPGFFFDTNLYSASPVHNYFMGYEYGDQAWALFRAAASGFVEDYILQAAAEETAPQRRFVFLVQNGLLPLYYLTLQDEVERFARHLRRQFAAGPAKTWGVFVDRLPADWYSLGLLRGLSTPGNPVILLSFEPDTKAYLPYLLEMDIHALHAFGIIPIQYSLKELPAMGRLVKAQHDGYWLSSLEAILQPEGVRTHNGTVSAEAYARAIKAAFDSGK